MPPERTVLGGMVTAAAVTKAQLDVATQAYGEAVRRHAEGAEGNPNQAEVDRLDSLREAARVRWEVASKKTDDYKREEEDWE